MMLPNDIELVFFKTMMGEVSIDSFEKWLYQNTALEQVLPADDYLELIALPYKQPKVKYDLLKLLVKNTSAGRYENYKLMRLLTEARERTDKLADILEQFYDLYCHGYSFLDNLGLVYGLPIVAIWGDEPKKAQQGKILDGFYPGLNEELDIVIDWLTSHKIVLTGEVNDLGQYEYQDHRDEIERARTLYL